MNEFCVLIVFIDFESKTSPLFCLFIVMLMIATDSCHVLISLLQSRIQLEAFPVVNFCFIELFSLIINVSQSIVQLKHAGILIYHQQIPFFTRQNLLLQRIAKRKSIIGVTSDEPSDSISPIPLNHSSLVAAYLILDTTKLVKGVVHKKRIILNQFLVIFDRLLNDGLFIILGIGCVSLGLGVAMVLDQQIKRKRVFFSEWRTGLYRVLTAHLNYN